MAFKARSRRPERRIVGPVGEAASRLVWLAARFVLGCVTLALLSSGVLYLRLADGPVALPGLNRFLVEQANESSDQIRVAVGSTVLDLGDGTVPTGLEFRDVVVRSAEGDPLFSIPRLRAGFDLPDLLRGLVRPVRISVVSANARFIRGRDGRIRFALGGGEEFVLDQEDAASTDEGAEAISALVNGFVGDAELAPEASKLRRIEILDAGLQYSDRVSGGEVAVTGANLRIRRDDGGATAILDIGSGAEAAGREIIRLVANRRAGSGSTSVAGRFGQVDPRKLAGIAPLAGLLQGLDTIIEGEVSARFGEDGLPTGFAGVIVADGGRLVWNGDAHPFEVAALSLRGDLSSGVVEVTNAVVSGPAGDKRLTGLIHLGRDDDGVVRSGRMQFDVEELSLAGGGFFADPVRFDGGQIVAEWNGLEAGLRIAESWLSRGDLVFRVAGRVGWPDGMLSADLVAESPAMEVADLVRHWPAEAAASARGWVAENITKARLQGLTAELRVRGEETRLDLTAGFSDLTATYIDGMSPIEEASGALFVDLNRMHLVMEEGQVAAADGGTIALGGSSVVISAFDAPVTPADVRIRARGATATVLALIDQPPLFLTSALGLDLGPVKGDAEVEAGLRFPLLAALKVRDVEVDAKAALSDVALKFDAGAASGPIDVRSKRLELAADVRRMRLNGRVRIDGAAANLDWREDYSSRPGQRQVRLSGATSPAMFAALGLDRDIVTGSARVGVDLSQRGSEAMRFVLDADLKKAGLKIDALGWSKQAGTAGSLKAVGSVGVATVIDKLELEAPGLTAAGGIELGADGAISRASFTHVRMPGRMDTGVTYQKGGDGVPEVRLVGRLLDVSDRLSGGEDGTTADPVRLRLSLEQLRVTENTVVKLADGRIERQTGGAVTGEITGALGPEAPVAISLDLPVKAPGRITLTSPNAGAALRHADIYRGATGGKLRVEATMTEGGAVTGRARIDNVVVRSQATFKNVLEDGGLADAGKAVSGSGLSFRLVLVPFRYDGGVVTVTDAIAVSPVLGLKMNGTLDENAKAVDMTGVLSPAYALTGALNEIPLLGEILSGGRGEGILGMTFTLKGAMQDPKFSVNPLSLLAPGMLRKLFSGGGGNPQGGGAEEFTPGLDR